MGGSILGNYLPPTPLNSDKESLDDNKEGISIHKNIIDILYNGCQGVSLGKLNG